MTKRMGSLVEYCILLPNSFCVTSYLFQVKRNNNKYCIGLNSQKNAYLTQHTNCFNYRNFIFDNGLSKYSSECKISTYF